MKNTTKLENNTDRKEYFMHSVITRIHFVGIGGVGMVGIAEVLHYLGMKISGSDIIDSANLENLRAIGIEIQIGHVPDLIKTAEVVVATSAVNTDNPEIKYALKARMPVIPRAEMLAELMRERYGIAVSGTHGKTTTTSLLASLLTEGKKDPTYVIGGKLNHSGKNALLGKGSLLVAEADESDASFLHLKPRISIVTNIDADHMDAYQGNMDNLCQVFIQFLQHLPFYGKAVLCIDDENVRKIIPNINRPIKTYGFSDDADVRASNLTANGLSSKFTVVRKNQPDFDVELSIPGRHNVLNSLACIAVGEVLGLNKSTIKNCFKKFRGVSRRFEVYKCKNLFAENITLVDDYGHHPTEIDSVLLTARQVFKKKRLVLLFQPHRYSRTRDLFDNFVKILPKADLLVLTEVYSAGEKPIPQFGTKNLVTQIRLMSSTQVVAVDKIENLDEIMTELINNEDVLITMGAGDIGQISKNWRIKAQSAKRQFSIE